MKTIRKMRRKLNNKGLSLVEVIIAVVILAAVVAPTMRLFASSASYNNKSRESQRAYAIAESAMESFKAYDLEELCIQFGQGTFPVGVPHPVFAGVSSDGTTTRTVTATTTGGSAVNPLVDSNNKLNDSAANFNFKVQNAVEEGHYYDVEIVVNEVGEKSVVKTDAVNPYTDMVHQMQESDTTTISSLIYAEAENVVSGISAPADMVTGGSLTLSSVSLSSLEREITFTVDHQSSGDKVNLEIKYTYSGELAYQYTSKNPGAGVKTVSNVGFSDTLDHVFDASTGATSLTVYDNTVNIGSKGGKLENMYLYYYPLYDSIAGASVAKDTIKVDASSASAPIEVHIAKQKYSSSIMSDGQIETQEGSYEVKVEGSGNVTLDTNLRECVTGNTGTTITSPTLTGFGTPADFVAGSKENKDLIYKVVVYVYNAGETSPIAMFEGTKNN